MTVAIGGTVGVDVTTMFVGMMTATGSGPTSSTSFTLLNTTTGESYTFTGTGFTGFGSNGRPTGGSVTGVVYSQSGAPVLTMTNVIAAWTDFNFFLVNNNALGMANHVFRVLDTITGSSANDVLRGNGGDVINAGDGDDVVSGSIADRIDGGNGEDTAHFNAFSVNALSLVGLNTVSGATTFGAAVSRNIEHFSVTSSARLELTIGALIGSNTWTSNGAGSRLIVDFSAETGDVTLTPTLLSIFGGQLAMTGVAAFTITGGSGNDTFTATASTHLSGSGGNDIFYGAAGNDTINAGGNGGDVAGFDVASTAASWSFDAITQAWTVSSAEGVDTLTGVEVLRFTDRDVLLNPPSHVMFGDNLTSDLVLQRPDGGVTFYGVLFANLQGSGGTQAPTNGGGWSAVAIGNFNGDAYDDILLRRASDNFTFIQSITSSYGNNAGAWTSWQAGAEWVVQGAADLDGDGTDEIVWRRSSDGVTSVWSMDGATTLGAAPTLWQAGLEWEIVGFGDFDGDSHDDFLWQRTSDNALAIWRMDGTNVIAADVTGQQAGSEWSVAGVGDFNGDLSDDLLLRRDDGVMAIWMMDGFSILQADTTEQQAGADWHVAAVGDYNGDGLADIMLQQTGTNVIAIWTMQGFDVYTTGLFPIIPASGWTII